jgi:hypothetical protein
MRAMAALSPSAPQVLQTSNPVIVKRAPGAGRCTVAPVMSEARLGAGEPGESTQGRRPGAYIKVFALAAGSGISYFAFAARWPGEPITIRLVLAGGLVAINAIGDSIALRQRRLGEAWSAAHPVDALDGKPAPALELPIPPDNKCDQS